MHPHKKMDKCKEVADTAIGTLMGRFDSFLANLTEVCHHRLVFVQVFKVLTLTTICLLNSNQRYLSLPKNTCYVTLTWIVEGNNSHF